ncbi:hypothetical protein F4861DRAFT_314941 [Xylaria intraflava]|nr:hypothetical protein F4861DRAFT_314941 [Xylaria intraflava]
MEYQETCFAPFPRLGYDIQYLIFKQATLDYFRSNQPIFRVRIASEHLESVLSKSLNQNKIIYDEFAEVVQACPIGYVCCMARRAFCSTVRRMNPVYHFDKPTDDQRRATDLLSNLEEWPIGMKAMGSSDRPNDSTATPLAGFLKGNASTIYLNFDPSEFDLKEFGPLQPLFSSVKRIILGYDYWCTDPPRSFWEEPFTFQGFEHKYRCPHSTVNPDAAVDDGPKQTMTFEIDDRPSRPEEEFPAWRTGNMLVEIARMEIGKPMSYINWDGPGNALILRNPTIWRQVKPEDMRNKSGFFPELECVSIVAWKTPWQDDLESLYSSTLETD